MHRHNPVGNHRVIHPKPLGRRAVVVGAGIGGLAAAGAVADWFDQVIVLERDTLSGEPGYRPGTPQARHSHGLLVGGLNALDGLFPGIGRDFAAAGAVPVRVNRDLREEPARRDPMPQRDFGLVAYMMSRPLIELTLRQCLARRSNVMIRHGTRALAVLAGDAGRINGIRCVSSADGNVETLPAELVVDASGRGHLTAALLQSIGRTRVHDSTIGIDLGYTTAVMPIPEGAPSDWKVVLTHPDAPESSRRAVLLPIEGNRWMLTAAGRGSDLPPAEWDALLAYLRELATPTIHQAVSRTRPIGALARFVFTESVWRHFERIPDFPAGLIPIGDAICRFNPIYGQGMTVASKEAALLHRLLAESAAMPDPLEGLGQQFLAEAATLVETPWSMAAVPDFAYPDTRGDRPANLEQSLAFGAALSRIAARDAAVQQVMIEVWHMVKPHTAYQEADLVGRVQAEIAEMPVNRAAA